MCILWNSFLFFACIIHYMTRLCWIPRCLFFECSIYIIYIPLPWLTLFILRWLYSNRLSGLVPSEIGLLTNFPSSIQVNKNLLSGTIPLEVEAVCKPLPNSTDYKSFQCNLFVGPTNSNCMFDSLAACGACPTGSTPAADNTPRGQCTQPPTCNATSLTLPAGVAGPGSCVGSINAGSTCSQSCFDGTNYTYFCRLGDLVNSASYPTCSTIPCFIPSDSLSTNYSGPCGTSPIPSGSSCVPICKEGYTATGSLRINCTLGSFSTPAGTCNENPSGKEVVPSSSSSSDSNTPAIVGGVLGGFFGVVLMAGFIYYLASNAKTVTPTEMAWVSEWVSEWVN
jgi:hypothetical protein